MKEWILLSIYSGIESAGLFMGINVYAGIPPADAGFTSPSWIYGYFPASPIRREAGSLYSEEWTWPDDYFQWQTFPEGTDVIIAADSSGGVKGYEYDIAAGEALLNSGWGATVTQEGSIIYHGPRNDSRSEICILVPYGYSLDGMDIGDSLSVTQAIEFGQNNWARDGAYTRQVFNVLYDDSDSPRQIIQEVTWDTDTLIPCVKTTYTSEHIHRFDIKEYVHYWYQDTRLDTNVYRLVPVLSFSGAQSSTYQIRLAMDNVDALKAKYAAESNTFDKYRNPDLVP